MSSLRSRIPGFATGAVAVFAAPKAEAPEAEGT